MTQMQPVMRNEKSWFVLDLCHRDGNGQKSVPSTRPPDLVMLRAGQHFRWENFGNSSNQKIKRGRTRAEIQLNPKQSMGNDIDGDFFFPIHGCARPMGGREGVVWFFLDSVLSHHFLTAGYWCPTIHSKSLWRSHFLQGVHGVTLPNLLRFWYSLAIVNIDS